MITGIISRGKPTKSVWSIKFYSKEKITLGKLNEELGNNEIYSHCFRINDRLFLAKKEKKNAGCEKNRCLRLSSLLRDEPSNV